MTRLLLLLFSLIPFASSGANYTVFNTNDAGQGSLRQAILEVNANPGPHLIQFSIQGNGSHTIALESALPGISNTVTIDGYTQPGSQPNTLANSNNAVLLIRLDGGSITNGTPAGLNFYSSGNVVRGLIIVRFHDGIFLNSSSSNVIAGNFIGYDEAGRPQGNAAHGVRIFAPVFARAGGNLIGGTTPGARNVISSNLNGIFLFPGTVGSNFIQGNFIGTDASGREARPNSTAILVQGSTNNLIGGVVPGARNLISGNRRGLEVLAGSGNRIQGNYVGTDVSGSLPLGNFFWGIKLQGSDNTLVGGDNDGARNVVSGNSQVGLFLLGGTDITVHGNSFGRGADGLSPLGNGDEGIHLQGASRCFIGGLGLYEPNSISHNGAAGVRISSGDRNAVRNNYISDNGGLSIDVGSTGVLTNDIGDGDTGGNQQQNYPILTSATFEAGLIHVQGTLNSATNASFLVDLYWSLTTITPGKGEAIGRFATVPVTTDGAGNANFAVTTVSPVSFGFPVSATATDTNNNTSEFSPSVIVAEGPVPVPLAVRRVGGAPTLQWLSAASGYQLECADDLRPPISWQVVTNGIQNDGTLKSFTVTNHVASTNRFYRLRRQ
jgi:parallel beta-helix repeat protein